MHTLTERGFRWVFVSLILASVANTVLFVTLFVAETGGVGGFGSLTLVGQIWEILLFASVAPGSLGFRALRAGGHEFGPAHARIGRRGVWSFFVGAAAAGLFLATGLVLGLVYVPEGAYTAGSAPTAVWSVLVGDSIRGIHGAAPAVIALFVGLFLLSFVWSFSSRLLRVLAGAAFILGVSAPVVGLVSLEFPSFPLTLGVFLGVTALPVASLALWAAVYLIVLQRLRGSVAAPVTNLVSA